MGYHQRSFGTTKESANFSCVVLLVISHSGYKSLMLSSPQELLFSYNDLGHSVLTTLTTSLTLSCMALLGEEQRGVGYETISSEKGKENLVGQVVGAAEHLSDQMYRSYPVIKL